MMPNLKLLIDMPVYPPVLEKLKQLPAVSVQLIENPAEVKRALPVQLIQDADMLFCTIPPENHVEMKQLKLLQIASAGFTQLIGKGWESRNITACNALGVFDVPIAEWNIAMMINMARNMKAMIFNQQAAVWDRNARFQKEIRGSVVGLWGYGGIGRETARLAKQLGMQVHVLNRSELRARTNTYAVPGTGDPAAVYPDRVFSMREKKEFLRGIDFLILAIPQVADTVGIIGENELRELPPHAYLLNPARGPLVKEEALLKALRENWIAGAALDTHYYYPMPADHPLWQMPNVLMTPHISGSSASNRFLERIWDIFYQNVTRFAQGKEVLNKLSAEQLKG